MNDEYDRPVTRGDLVFTVEMALREAEHLWPKKRRPGDHDRLLPVAKAVVGHLELRGMRCFSKAPRPGHGTPDLGGTVRESGAPDGANDGDG
ncbi:MAG: hypothetical protein OYL41_15205 [Acidobacteriota bacterium]|nr:hypothetical protein [Acidobacteriota bacterium]